MIILRYCTECGRKLKGIEKFCPGCGRKLNNIRMNPVENNIPRISRQTPVSHEDFLRIYSELKAQIYDKLKNDSKFQEEFYLGEEELN